MKIERTQLIEELTNLTNTFIQAAREFKKLNEDQLNFKPGPESWSILECLEHLNLYGDFYLVEIEDRMIKAKNSPEAIIFKSGVLGNYFANLIVPKEGQIKKMKTLKDMDPANSGLTITTVDRFLKQQERFQGLLDSAKTVDLTKVKTSITFTNLIKLRLGDTLRFVAYHNQRHVLQANNVLKGMYLSKDKIKT